MQSKINNDIINSGNNINTQIIDKDELLLTNKDIINSLILENCQKKDKSFITVKELEIIQNYENNLLKLLEICPPEMIKSLMKDTSDYEVSSPDLNLDK